MRHFNPKLDSAWIRVYRAGALTKQQGRCAYCKCPLPAAKATADHQHPRKRYGKTSADNIVAACRQCNQAKGHMSEGQFYKLIKSRIAPKGAPHYILSVWMSRRIWRRTHLACERITAAAKFDNAL